MGEYDVRRPPPQHEPSKGSSPDRRAPAPAPAVPAASPMQESVTARIARSYPAIYANAQPAPTVAPANPELVAAIASLRAAAVELDQGAAELHEARALAAQHVGTNVGLRTHHHWQRGLQHLGYAQVRVVIGDLRHHPELQAPLAVTAAALGRFVTATRDSAVASEAGPYAAQATASLGVMGGAVVAPGPDRADPLVPGPDRTAVPEGGVVEPALAIARREAERLHGALVAEPMRPVDATRTDSPWRVDEAAIASRGSRVAEGAARIVPSLRYAVAMMRTLGEDERRRYVPALEGASAPIAGVLRWLRGRPAATNLVAEAAEVVRLINAARQLAGLVSLGGLPASSVLASEHAEEQQEAAFLEREVHDLRDAYEVFMGHAAAGIRNFETLATIKEVEPPSFWSELGKAVLVATLGHLAGGLGSLVVGKLGQGDAQTPGVLRDIVVDSTQGIVAKIAEDAFAGADREAATARLFASFVRGLDVFAVDSARAAKARVNAVVAEQRVTVAELEAMRHAIEAAKDDGAVIMVQHAARAWANLVAQSRLGVQRTPSPDGAGSRADLSGYLGTTANTDPRYDWVERKDSKWGTEGVLRVHIEIHDEEDATPRVRIVSADLNGLNRDLGLAVIQDGVSGFKQLRHVGVVTEISAWKGTKNARLVIDEAGNVRDEFRWSWIRRWNARTGTRAPNARFYEEPASFWQVVGAMKLAAGVIQ